MRSYYMRLEVTDPVAAEDLLIAFEEVGPALIQRRGDEILLLWPAIDADDPDEWEEQTFAELMFFLRAWRGLDPRRSVTVLEERSLELPDQVFRLAS